MKKLVDCHRNMLPNGQTLMQIGELKVLTLQGVLAKFTILINIHNTEKHTKIIHKRKKSCTPGDIYLNDISFGVGSITIKAFGSF